MANHDSAARNQSQAQLTMRHMLVGVWIRGGLMIVMHVENTFAPTAFFLALVGSFTVLMHWLSRPARDSRRHRFEIGNNAFLRSWRDARGASSMISSALR